jgi:hypothetical protein
MRWCVAWSPAETVPERAEVLSLQGLPPGAEPSPRIAALLDAARADYLELAEPRAMVAEISRQAFAGVYRGEGRNAPETPLEAVCPRADRLALFAATVGAPVTARVRELFTRNQPALAALLDSVASAAADRLAARVGSRYLERAGVDVAGGCRVLAYSPGYCGWHVSGQRALFAFLAPGEIGITLNASCLMEPLKSVSGVLVAGPAEIHRFTPDYAFCPDCREQPCRKRIAALSEPGA